MKLGSRDFRQTASTVPHSKNADLLLIGVQAIKNSVGRDNEFADLASRCPIVMSPAQRKFLKLAGAGFDQVGDTSGGSRIVRRDHADDAAEVG